MQNRAQRRHDTKRVKQKALRLVKEVWRSRSEQLEKWAIKNADHLRNCSCSMCENPRKRGELTMQEKRLTPQTEREE